MTKYRSYMQEYFRTYDNPIEEDVSKTIISYLKFYDYIPLAKSKRFVDRSYKTTFSNGNNIATLLFGEGFAVLTEFEGKVEVSPSRRIDFIKQEILEYMGTLRDRCIIYTTDKYRKSFYYGPLNYQGMRDFEYYSNKIPSGTMPDGVRDHSEFPATMMKIIAAAEYGNEIRCLREEEPVYQGKQVKR